MADKPMWGKRPAQSAPTTPDLDAFVSGKAGKQARLNFAVPEELHRRVKAGCAADGLSMTDLVVEFLEKRFPKPKPEAK